MRQNVTLQGLGLLRRLGVPRREMTQAESVLWRELKGGKLLGREFARRQQIDGYVVGFYCRDPALAIEVDGKDEAAPFACPDNRARDVRLRLLGVTVLRFTHDEVVHDLETVLSRIRQSIRYRISGGSARGL